MKKNFWVVLGISLLIVEIILVAFSYCQDDNNKIPNNYIAVFKGESGDVVHSTYIYRKLSSEGKQVTYRYINTITTFTGYDKSDITETVVKKGNLTRFQKIFDAAMKNDAYSYVKYDDGYIYHIKDFHQKFH